LKALADATGFKVARINFAAGPFNFVRSMKYLSEQKDEQWPPSLRSICWDRNQPIRRILNPILFSVYKLGFGGFLHATLRKTPALEIFKCVI